MSDVKITVGGTMEDEAARRFVLGKLFSYSCFGRIVGYSELMARPRG